MRVKKLSLSVFSCLLFLFIGQTAWAGTGGREKGRSISYMYHLKAALIANRAYAIETFNLSPGADTVLHVQDEQTGGFIAGNDDYFYDPRSLVWIDPQPATRYVRIIVRAYSPQSSGTATLRITPSTGSVIERQIQFGPGYKRSFSSFRAGSHFFTIEEQGGTPDTILLVTSGSQSRAIAFDDNHGMGNMSWVHVDEGCSSACSAIVGTYNASHAGRTATFMWDEDIHDPSRNCDNDGMSDSLELAIGTDPCKNDTDGDGLDDGVETMGIDGPDWKLTRFPYFGADPLHPDVFLEADWKQCNSTTEWCGPSNDRDFHRLKPEEVAKLASVYAPDVRVHVDNGIPNGDPATWFQYGDWGGAKRFEGHTRDKCQFLSQARHGYFHGVRLLDGGQGDRPGPCLDVSSNARHVAHELGHNFNLTHGGKQSAGWDVNCKPNYPSLMSYAGIYDTDQIGFSRNRFASLQLNPMYMDEQKGLNTTDPQILGWLSSPSGSFRYSINGRGIDWNRDGKISAGKVRAAATWGWGKGGGCEQGGHGRDVGPSGHRIGSALAWLPGNGSGASRLFWLTPTVVINSTPPFFHTTVEYRTATQFPENCGSPPSSNCRTNWAPVMGLAGNIVPGSQSAISVSATWYRDRPANEYRLIVVMRLTNDRVISNVYAPGSGWQGAEYIGGAGDTVSGDVAVFRCPLVDYAVCVYAPSGNRLKMWRRQSDGTWRAPVNQVWEGGTPIQPAFGIALTEGWRQLASEANSAEHDPASIIGPIFPPISPIFPPLPPPPPRIFAAIPVANSDPPGRIELAWTSNGLSWTRLEASAWTTGRAVTKAQPGLAYVPFEPSGNYEEGRFYLSWIRPDEPNGDPWGIHITQTEGNDLSPGATSRRLRWLQSPVYLTNTWLYGSGNVSLLFERGIDRNMRAAVSFPTESDGTLPIFFPFADGIFNGDLRDQDDFAVIRANLACSLHRGASCPM